MIKKIEKVFKALGEKNRLKIINMLMSKPMCVCEITFLLKLSQSTVSGHLRVLKEAGLIADIKEGLWVEYSLVKNDDINKTVFKMLKPMYENDEVSREERGTALLADREVLCKK